MKISDVLKKWTPEEEEEETSGKRTGVSSVNNSGNVKSKMKVSDVTDKWNRSYTVATDKHRKPEELKTKWTYTFTQPEDEWRFPEPEARSQTGVGGMAQGFYWGDNWTGDGSGRTWSALGDREMMTDKQRALADRLAEYNTLSTRPDFKKYSTYDPSLVNDPLYGAVNGDRQAQIALQKDDPEGLRAMIGTDKSFARQMNPYELSRYNYIRTTRGAEAADQYLEDIRSDLQSRQMDKRLGKAEAFADRHPVGAQLLSYAMPSELGIYGAVGDWAKGEKLDPNAGYRTWSRMQTALRSADSSAVEREVSLHFGEAAGKLAGKGYNLLTSYSDSRINQYMFPGMEAVSLLRMGAQAASHVLDEAQARGLNDNRALALSLIAGAAEVATEQYSLEALLNADPVNEGMIRTLFKQMAAEGSEEMASEAINAVADYMISGDKAEARQSYYKHINEDHMSPEKARLAVCAEIAGQIVESGIGGALMGGLGGVTIAGMSELGAYQTGRDLHTMTQSYEVPGSRFQHAADWGDVQRGVITAAQQQPVGTRAKTLGDQARAKIDAGGQLSDLEFGRLYTALDAQQQALQERTDERVREKLQQQGEDIERQTQDTLLDLARDKVAEETGVDMTQAVEEAPAESRQNEARAAETAQKETARTEEETSRSEAQSEAAEAENETEFVELGGEENEAAFAELQGEEETRAEAPQTRTQERTSPSLRTMNTRMTEAYKEAFDPAQLEKVKSAFGEAGQKALTDNYKGEQMTAPYVRGFMAFYNAGLTGTRASDVSLGARTLISTDTAVRAWAAGRQDAQAKNAQLTAQKGSVAVVQNPGIDYSDAKTNEWAAKNGETARRVNQLTQALGMSMTVEDIIRVGKTGEANAQLLNARLTLSNNAEKRTATYRGENISNPVMWTIGHEVGHRLRELAPEAFDALAKTMPQEAVRDIEWQQYAYAKAGVDEKFESAAEEAAANYVADLLEGGQVLDEFIARQTSAGNRSLLQKIGDAIRNVYRDVKAYLSGDEARAIRQSIKKLEAALDAAAEQAAENAKNGKFAENETQKAASAADIQKSNYSIKSSFEAIGMDARLEGGRVVVYDQNGNRVEHVTEQHVRGSVLGAMIDYALNETGTITEAEAKKQIKGMTDLLNIMIKAQDGELVWKFSGAAMFSAVKSNSDGQYGTTVDFSTVCRKTQEMMDAMSEAMIRLGRGLTKAEVIELQADILSEGGTVPCPVCYVFSRWAGVGGILDNMAKWQERYKGIEWDDPAKVQVRINEIKAATRTKADLRRTLMEQDQRYIDLAAQKEDADRKRTELRNKSKRATLTEEERTQIDKEIRALKAMSDGLNKQMKEIENSGAPEAAWLERVRIKPDYREHGDVPLNVLYNLSDAEEMAGNYPLAWGYRTTRGPSAGKAILPYADMRVGDMVMGPGKNRVKGNAFETLSATLTDDQRSEIEKALMRVKAQNLIGGQRYQSTSDFRYDYGLDYLLSFFEGQMLGTKMQTYTKIIEFVDMVNAVRGDVNISMMPYEAGYVEENGVDKLVYSSVTGVNEEAAIRANSLYDNAQLILVGINDRHIRAALEDSEETGGIHIGFVIPYHASGASINEFIRGLVENLSESFNEEYYRDYSKIQTDSVSRRSGAAEKRLREIRDSLLRGKHKVTTTDPVTGKTTTGQRDWRPTEQDLALIRGKSKDISGMSFDALRDIERRALAGDKAAIREYKSWSAGVLWDIYNKMWVDESAEETYGVRLNTAQAASIMPHEYWNKSVSRDKAYVNGFIFRSYCYNLGLTPRFTGVDSSGRNIGYGDFSDSRGYWKTLIDRPMYDNSGRYRDQQRINVTRLSDTISESDAGMLSPEYGETAWEGFKVREPEKAVSERAANKFVARKRAEGAKLSLKQRDADYAAAVERGDMDEAQRMVDEAASQYIERLLLPNDDDEKGFKYHRGPAPTKTFKRYAVLNVSPDGFRAAYAGNKNPTPMGVWLDAQNLQSYMSDMVQFDDGSFASYIPGDTGAATKTKFSPERQEGYGLRGGQRWLLERGGKHSSDVPNFSQMNLKQNENGEKVVNALRDGALPHNKLIFEIEYGISDEGDLTDYVKEHGRMMKGKNQGLAKIQPNQYYDFQTNPNAVGKWGIGGTFRIVRLVPYSEVVSVTNQYKENAIAEANRLYEEGEISRKARDTQIKNANAIQIQKWVNGYHPEDFGLTEESVQEMVDKGMQSKLTDPVTYDDNGNVIPLSERFNSEKQDIRYSLKGSDVQKEYMKPFAEQLRDYMDKEHRQEIFGRDSLLIGSTPKLLQDIGLPRLPVVINQKHVGYAIDDSYDGPEKYKAGHTFEIEEFAKLPEKLADPIAIIADPSKHDLVIYVEMTNKAGDQTIVPFRVNAEASIGGNSINVQRAKSVFGDEDAEQQIVSAIVKDNAEHIRVYYVNEKKIPSGIKQAVRKHGSQVPRGIIHSIHEEGSPVKPDIKSQTGSMQFKRWFGDWAKNPRSASKIVNEDGTPKIVYHQTAGDFTVFSNENPVAGATDSETPNGYFFKDNDHDIGLGGGRQMAVYLNMRKPLHFKNREEANRWYQRHVDGYADLQNEMQRKLDPIDAEMNRLENEMFGDDVTDEKYDELNARWDELHDEMKAVEDDYRGRLRELLNEHFLENDSGYDGIILDYDGHRYVNGKRENVKSYIVFKNTQIKSATNNVGTFDESNPDINYSLKGTETQREIAELREQVDRLRTNVERWKNETKRSDRQAVDPKAVERTARALAKEYTGSAKGADVTKDLESLYNFISHGGDGKDELTFESAFDRALAIADTLVENAVTQDDEAYREYEALRRYCRETPFVLGPEDAANITDYSSWAKGNRGRLRVKRGDRTNVDSYYQEMAQEWPEFFDPDITDPADQIQRIRSVLDGLYTINEYNPFSEHMEDAKLYAANDIMDRFWDVPNVKKTFADRAHDKLVRERIKWSERADRRVAQAVEIRDARIERLKDHYKTRIADNYAKQSAAKLRGMIERHAKALSAKLLRPTDKQHVPEELREPVAKVLASINLGSAKLRNGEVTKRTQAFAELKKAYSQIAGQIVIDPELIGLDGQQGLLDQVIAMSDTPIAAMNKEQLQVVWQALRAVEGSVQTANKNFRIGRAATIEEVANGLREDNKGKVPPREWQIGGKLQKLTGLDMMTPEAYFHRLGATGEAVFRALRDAQDRFTVLVNETAEATKSVLGSYDTNKAERQTVTVRLGQEDVQLTRAQLMELYVLMRREQAQQHVLLGGLLPEAIKGPRNTKIVRAEPVRGITLDQCVEAFKQLTDEEIRIAEGLQRYLSEDMSDRGNEASMEVYGYKKFGEKNYWPLRTNKQETKSTVEKDTQITSVAGKGFTKATIPNADNSVQLGSIFDTYSKHVAEMSTYAAYLAATEDVNRLRNWQFREENTGRRTGSTKGILDRVFGQGGSAYLSKLLSDVAVGVSGNTVGTEYAGTMTGAFKSAAIGANIRVIMQQPTAILRAGEMIDARYLAKGQLHPFKGWERAVKYAPIAQWKDWGYFDIGTGRSMKNVILDADHGLEKMKNKLSEPAGKADSFAWGILWNAVEAEMKDRNKDLKPGTNEFYEACAKRFTEIVDHTQVVDGVLQRAQIMRSSDGLVKMATSFMSEPTKQWNQFWTAVYDVKHASGDDRKKAKQQMVRAIIALLASFAANAAAQSLIDAMRDSNRDKKYWERFMEAYTGFEGFEEGKSKAGSLGKAIINGNFSSNLLPFEYVPFIKDASSIMQGYDVSRTDMSVVSDTWRATQNAWKALNGQGKMTVGNAITSMGLQAAKLAGIPFANLQRDALALLNTVAVETDSYLMEYYYDRALYGINLSSNNSRYYDTLYRAYVNDQEQFEILYDELLKNGFEAEKIKSNMESRMKKTEGVNSVKDLSHRFVAPK